MNISGTKALKNNTVVDFFHNITVRGWALLNDSGLVATDCYNCNKYGNGCDKHMPEPCKEYGKLLMVKDNWHK
jgi:hypothetical protein